LVDSNADSKNKDLNLINFQDLPVCYNTQKFEASYKFDSNENMKNLTNKEIVHESYFKSTFILRTFLYKFYILFNLKVINFLRKAFKR